MQRPDSDSTMELAGYALWVLGSLFFLAVGLRDGDALSIAGSALFFVGILVVMVPMVKRLR